MSVVPVPIRRAMVGRDPHELGRVATPLELFFDLVFVVAIASNAAQLHHGLTGGHLDAVVGYTMSWFAIWWAWMNYTWFASAYDNDDVVFRLLSFVIMTGALILAAGIPDLFDDGQSVTAVVGYAVMRLGMVALWLRAASGHDARRVTALTYAGAIFVVQLFWIARLWVPESWYLPTFFLGVALELSVPLIAEARHGYTPFHPHHIAERYGLLTIIVLGEVILSSVTAIQQVLAGSGTAEEGHALSSPAGSHAPLEAATSPGINDQMLLLIAGGLLMVFSIWWLYFKREHADLLEETRSAWVFGYGHLVVFASVAAVGAGLAAGVDVSQHASDSTSRTISLVIAVAISLYVLTLAGLHAVANDGSPSTMLPAAVVSIAVLAIAAAGLPMGWAIFAQGLVLGAAVAQHVGASHRMLVPQ